MLANIIYRRVYAYIMCVCVYATCVCMCVCIYVYMHVYLYHWMNMLTPTLFAFHSVPSQYTYISHVQGSSAPTHLHVCTLTHSNTQSYNYSTATLSRQTHYQSSRNREDMYYPSLFSVVCYLHVSAELFFQLSQQLTPVTHN